MGGGTGVFRVALEGGAPGRGFQGPPGGGVTSLSITADNAYVVYERISGPNFGKVREIFSEPLLGGGTVLALSGPVFLGGGLVSGFQLSPTGRQILYDGRGDSSTRPSTACQ